MRTTIRTMLLAALWLGLALPLATPSRADDAPAEIVSLLERARAAERVEKDLAKAQALYEQVFAKAASTDAGREAGVRLLDLDAGRTHEAWLTLIGTLSEAHGAELDEVTVDKIVELARRHVQPGEMVKTPRGTFFGVAQVQEVPATASPADIALSKGFQHLGAAHWYKPGAPLDGAEMDLDRLLQGLGAEARPAVDRWLERGADVIPGLLALMRLDAVAGWQLVGQLLRDQPAAERYVLSAALDKLAVWGRVSPAVLGDALRPVLLAPNADKVIENVFSFLARRVDVASIPSYVDMVAAPGLKRRGWIELATRSRENATDVLRLAELVRTRAFDMTDLSILAGGLWGRNTRGPGTADAALQGARLQLALALLEAPAVKEAVGQLHAPVLGGPSAEGLRHALEIANEAQGPDEQQRLGDAVGALLLGSIHENRRWLLQWGPDALPVRLRSGGLTPDPQRVLELLETGVSVRPRPFLLRVRAEALAVPGVWDVLLTALIEGSDERAKYLAWVLDAHPRPAWPVDIGPTCLRLVESVAARGGRVPPESCLHAAASEDPSRYDEAVLDALGAFRVKAEHLWADPLVSADLPRIRRWLDRLPSTEAATAKGMPVGSLRMVLMRLLLDRGAVDDVVDLAANRADPTLAIEALRVLIGEDSAEARDALLRLAAADAGDAAWMAGAGRDRAPWWIGLAEGTPSPLLTNVLLAIYEHNPLPHWRDRAAKALDAIRERQERISYFQTMLDGPDDPEGEILPLLDDADAAVRQGAIQALGAVGGPRALVRLLKLAKREGAPASERAAALEAVATISARAPGGAAPHSSPVPAASDDAR
ncbi:MAG: HEAT repeat domain-containing protein [Planctomycetota bacterium]